MTVPVVTGARSGCGDGDGGGGGVVGRDVAIASADTTADQATWTDITGLEAEVPASEGDVLLVSVDAYPNAFSGGNNLMLDARCPTSGNRVSGGTGNADFGILRTLRVGTNGSGFTRSYVVQAGDLAGGTITMRAVYRVTGGSATLTASANFRAAIDVVNLGAVVAP